MLGVIIHFLGMIWSPFLGDLVLGGFFWGHGAVSMPVAEYASRVAPISLNWPDLGEGSLDPVLDLHRLPNNLIWQGFDDLLPAE